MRHRLEEVTLSNYQSFDSVGATISGLRRINVFSGANNAGKSKLLRAVERLAPSSGSPYLLDETGDKYNIAYRFEINPDFIKTMFASSSGQPFGGNWWQEAGRFIQKSYALTELNLDKNQKPKVTVGAIVESQGEPLRLEIERQLRKRPELNNPAVLPKLGFFIAAERDIRPEGSSSQVSILPNGQGITNAIRRNLLVSTEDSSLVRVHMLRDLNALLHPQYEFKEIVVREHEQHGSQWEVHFVTPGGDVVRLSQCGSGLKTILCLLANVHLKFRARSETITDGLFLLEELENSLHPRVQRNLYQYIDEKFVGSSVCLVSTHSPVALDFFQGRADASFFHVFQESEQARCRRVDAFDDRLGILDALGVRASDALLSNFVVWVEGPTDRLYLNHMIRLLHGDALKEGRDYVVMFYGGRLLAHLTGKSEDASTELIKLTRINPKCAILIDSDKTEIGQDINTTKQRVISEFENGSRLAWVTQGREIENYLTPEFLNKQFGVGTEQLHEFSDVFEAVRGSLGPTGHAVRTKIDLAAIVEKHAGSADFRLDWRAKLGEIIAAIQTANA